MKFTCCPSCGSSFAAWSAPAKTLNKQPLILKCGHTFCEACIIQKNKKITTSQLHQSQVTCPTCKSITFLENGIKDLPVNVYLSAYIEISQRGKLDQQFGLGHGQFVSAIKVQRFFSDVENKENKCKMCVDTVATCKCTECDNMLCIACFEKVHCVSAAIKHHKPIPLSVNQLAPNNDGEPKCAEHNRILEYFCEDDSTSICSRCYIVGKHQNHSITSIEEKNKQVLEDIGIELPKARLVLKNLRKIDKKIVSSMPNIKTETKSLIENINHSFLRLHSLIQAREMEIIRQVYSAYKDHITSIDQQREALEKAKIELEDAIRKSNKLFENSALLLDGHALFETLRKARTTPCILVKTDAADGEPLMWHETHEQDLTAAINAYGSISGTPQQKLDFKTIEEASDSTEDDDKISINSLGSESSIHSVGGTVSIPGNASSIDTGEDVIIESEDMVTDSEMCKGDRVATREHIVLPVIKGPPQKVMVTHIRSPNDFFVQLACNKKQLETLEHNINTWCRRNASTKRIPLVIEKEMILLARYTADKQWYRAKVLNVERSTGEKDDNFKVHVKYIDFGNDELVPIKELRTMEKRFMKYPVFSVQCSLFDIAPFEENKPWSAESIKEFHKMTQNHVLMMTTFKMQGAVYEVDLSCIPMPDALDDNYVSVRDILIFLELARFRTYSDAATNTSAPPAYPKVDFIKPTSVKNGTTADIFVTQVTSPWDLHLVCIGEEHDYYMTMHDEMQQMYSKDICNIYSLFYPRADMVCAAKGDDDEWHRAKVMSSPTHKQVTVTFVDLGKTQTIHYDHLKKLHSSFIKLPIQAIPCRLVDICPTAGPASEWSDEAKLWCRDNLTGATGQARFIRSGQETQVVLWLESCASVPQTQSINSALVEFGLAQSTGPSSVKGAGESQTSSDRVIFKDSDYHPKRGQSEEVTAVSSLTKKLNKSSISPQKNQQSGSKQLNKSPVSTSSYKPRASKTAGSRGQKVSKVQQSAEEKHRIQQEIHKAMSTDGSPTVRESETGYIEVVICNYVSPSEFYVQVLDSQEDLMKLMKNMQDTFAESEPPPPRSWSVNEYCAAKYSLDGLWYRGNIMSKVSDEEYEVEYVDFGNVDVVKVSNLRPLAPEYGSRMPCAAARCHLSDLLPAGSMDINKWSQTAIEFMASLLKNRKLYIKQEGDPTGMGLPVDLIMEEEIPETAFEPSRQTYHSVRRAIIKNGLAMPTKKQPVPSSPDSPGINPFQRFIFEDENSSGSSQCQVVLDDSRDVNKHSVPNVTPDSSQAAAVVEEEEQSRDAVPERTEPHQAATLSLPPYPLPQLGADVKVVPTYVDKEGIIYAQPMVWEGKCAHLSSELQRIYVHVSPAVNIEWQVGQICVALFPDDSLWYRAVIREIKDGRFRVRYIDFGNSAWVKPSHLREMLPVFAEEHPLAYCCVLHDLEPISPTKFWPVEVLDYIHKLIVNQNCIFVTVEADESTPLKVQLFRGDINVCEDLIKKNLALSRLNIKSLYEQSYLIGQVLTNQNPYHHLDVGGVGDTFRAIMIHVELPNVVYLQRGLEIEPEETDFVKASEVAETNNSISEFVEMAERLKACRSLPMSHLPEVGLMCAALFSADDQLYRALCVQRLPETDSCLVVYVDYGTSEVVPRSRLRLLPSEFWSVPAQAIRCHISISSATESARQLTHHLFVGIISTLAQRELISRILKNDPLTVELMVEDDGRWRVPYKHLFEDEIKKPSSLGDQKEEDEEDADITLQEVKEGQNCRENWNDESDDESNDESLRTSEVGETEVEQRGEAGDGKSRVAKGKRVASLPTVTVERDKLREEIVIEKAEDVVSSGGSTDDDDDVDWVAVAARLVEGKADGDGTEEPSSEV